MERTEALKAYRVLLVGTTPLKPSFHHAERPLGGNIMQRTSLLYLGIAVVGLSGSPAPAACLDDIASLSPGTTTGPAAGPAGTAAPGRVSKDGTMAPLQTGSTAPASTSPATGPT